MRTVDELRDWAKSETACIFNWWALHGIDHNHGGFLGEVGLDNRSLPDAPKGAVLNARLLWFFSTYALDRYSGHAIGLAQRAWQSLAKDFVDEVNGGLYWSVTAEGKPHDRKKQAYAQAFGLYGLSAYYALTLEPAALKLAQSLFQILETRFWDHESGGYIEALGEAWTLTDELRLSAKDEASPKTMNSHLHILEAYTQFHRVQPTAAHATALKRVLTLMLDRFVENGHLNLFFSMDWQSESSVISFGHDIEASWLIWEAAETLGDATLLERSREVALQLAKTCLEGGLRPDGGLAYERHGDALDQAGEWWGQAEGLVGFVNAWQLDGDETWLAAADGLRQFIDREHRERGDGEWLWYPRISAKPSPYRAGLWKCPYHNGRALIEITHRLAGMTQSMPHSEFTP